jgi:hypothetical protein
MRELKYVVMVPLTNFPHRKLEFLDSQEFVFQHHKYMVTMKAKTHATIVAWDKAKLSSLHVESPNIKSSFFVRADSAEY